MDQSNGKVSEELEQGENRLSGPLAYRDPNSSACSSACSSAMCEAMLAVGSIGRLSSRANTNPRPAGPCLLQLASLSGPLDHPASFAHRPEGHARPWDPSDGERQEANESQKGVTKPKPETSMQTGRDESCSVHEAADHFPSRPSRTSAWPCRSVPDRSSRSRPCVWH
ncbi:hypothetical protein P4O66_008172 [Electrophorus voltai]|uniref:Uncharacterized protein n=1 Tax=Electrophorus voltai TaxID=2609070 RepID=A0AAD8ZEB7_9TELE|nr:hypothetical protein P4O66_008172 [Electrophorus voltai]